MNIKTEINFKDGIVIYENFFWLFQDASVLHDKYELSEDLLQVSFFNEEYILDIGWYPSLGKKGKFKIYVIKNHDWDNPIFVKSKKKISSLAKTIEEGVNSIYKDRTI